MKKINRSLKAIWSFGWLIIPLAILIYTRFVGIDWGLPYPIHPDERNMVVAIQSLTCNLGSRIFDLKSCFNPHFFAYGQFPLYLGYLIIWWLKFFDGDLGTAISFSEATFSLRIISGLASIINVFILMRIINFIELKVKNEKSKAQVKIQNLIAFILLIFAPYAIQYAHFGTTESLLMLFYSIMAYLSLLIVNNRISTKKFIAMSSLISGLALATKASSLIFVPITIIGLILKVKSNKLKAQDKIKNLLSSAITYILLTAILTLLFSPHNFIDWKEFLSSMEYESGVALGKIPVFYTRQFIGSIPIIFQSLKIFPYALGWPVFILFIIGFVFLPWVTEINILRLAFLVYFLPNAFIFAKWTRFMAPVFPIMIVIAILSLLRLKMPRIIFISITLIAVLPGIAYLSIYQNKDVRFTASAWINERIPNGSYILSETANVVDIPLPTEKRNNNYKIVSFDFYELENSPLLQKELKSEIKRADYIFVPSRRIFMNHSSYPRINQYYNDLFSGKLKFKKVVELSAYPKINLQFLKYKFQIQFPDEEAEETWTVFDHPVIRIYSKIKVQND